MLLLQITYRFILNLVYQLLCYLIISLKLNKLKLFLN